MEFKNKKKLRFIYYTCTAITLVSMLIFGFLDFIGNKYILESSQKLGFPPYFVRLIGFFKLFGFLGYFWNYKFSKELKEWIYFGFFIELFTAFICHIFIKDSFLIIILPLIFILPLLVSYILYKRYYV